MITKRIGVAIATLACAIFLAGHVMAEATEAPIKCTKDGKQIEVKSEKECTDQGGTVEK